MAVIEYDEAKILATDLVILVHGPAQELETVHRIYSCYLNDKLSETTIARLLQERQSTERVRWALNTGHGPLLIVCH